MSAMTVGQVAGRSEVRQERAEVVRPQMRLTRRGRIVFTLLGAALCAGVINFAGGAVAGGEAPASEQIVYTVGPGDTLWGVAESIAQPGQDVRDVVYLIQKANGLSGADLYVGQQISIPAGS